MAPVLTMLKKAIHPRDGVSSRGAAREPASSIVLVLMLVLLVVAGLAHAFTELFFG